MKRVRSGMRMPMISMGVRRDRWSSGRPAARSAVGALSLPAAGPKCIGSCNPGTGCGSSACECVCNSITGACNCLG